MPSLSGSGMPAGVITSLLPNGQTNPASLNIEMDLTVYPNHVGDTNSYVRIWGLSLAELSQAFNLNGQNIKIFGGMSKGYPLADPTEQGLLVKGGILQAFGNWIGTEQTLDIYLSGSQGTSENPTNYSFTWQKGEPLSAMIGRTLTTTLPGVQQAISVNQARVANQDKPGFYYSLPQFAQMVREMTKGQLGADDQGVTMTTNGQVVRVFEGSPTSAVNNIRQIKFQDLLGQPTWFAPQTLSIKMVMRGDLNPGDTIQLPTGILVTTTAPAMSAFGGTGSKNPSNTTNFGGAGQYTIIQMQHWGNFRQADASSWATMVLATPVTPQGGGGADAAASSSGLPAGALT